MAAETLGSPSCALGRCTLDMPVTAAHIQPVSSQWVDNKDMRLCLGSETTTYRQGKKIQPPLPNSSFSHNSKPLKVGEIDMYWKLRLRSDQIYVTWKKVASCSLLRSHLQLQNAHKNAIRLTLLLTLYFFHCKSLRQSLGILSVQ